MGELAGDPAGDVARLHDAIRSYDATGAFGEEDYLALRRLVTGVGRVDSTLLDGFIGLFFERHVHKHAAPRQLAAHWIDVVGVDLPGGGVG